MVTYLVFACGLWGLEANWRRHGKELGYPLFCCLKRSGECKSSSLSLFFRFKQDCGLGGLAALI